MLRELKLAIDFSTLMNVSKEAIFHPREIFLTLNRSGNFQFPRDIQTEVMNQWFDEYRNKKDSIIKLNVGSGKTLVGLLLLQSSLNEKKGPALYVVPDNQLAEQVIGEAKSLGLQISSDPKNPFYEAGDCICVINIHKLFNGKSVFGLGSSNIKIGTVIVDDAHACISKMSDQFRISLKKTEESYRRILAIFSEDIKNRHQAKFLEISDGDPRTHIEIPFWTWKSRVGEVLPILHEYRDCDDLAFSYSLLREHLEKCRCVIGGQRLEIEPPYPITDLIQSFKLAKRRIYMTATLSDDSPIVTHFGADRSNLMPPIVPRSSQSMGERMIVMPQELNPDITVDNIRKYLKALSSQKNTVVIVPSQRASKDWEHVTDQVLVGSNVADGIDRLRREHVGLTVLINRYDGIDLPGDACRVLVIAGLPEVASYFEELDAEVLSESTLRLRRQVERIEQGMGRGVRSNDDYCAVLLIGEKLTGRLRSPEAQDMLTPATRAQLDLSRQIAVRLQSASLDDMHSVIMQCLNRDIGWIQVSKSVLTNIGGSENLKLDDARIALKLAFDAACANQHENALRHLDRAIDGSEEIQIKAWLLSKKAMFQHEISPQDAQQSLIAAHSLEANVLRPLSGIRFRKIVANIDEQANVLIANHKTRFIDKVGLSLYANKLCSDLQFSPDTSELFESAIDDLAWFLGIVGQRPEKAYGGGPDNLWALSNGNFLVIECKNGATSEHGISKRDAGQLGQGVEWFRTRYLKSNSVPVMFHPHTTLGPQAAAVDGMRVIDENRLGKLRSSIQNFTNNLSNSGVSSNSVRVAEALAHSQLNDRAFIEAFTVGVRSV